MSDPRSLHDLARAYFTAAVSPTVSIDPNSVCRSDPRLTVAEIGDASRSVSEGDDVIAVQEGGGGDPDFVGAARVVGVNEKYGLLYLDVDWDSFRSPPIASAFQSLNSALLRAVSVPAAFTPLEDAFGVEGEQTVLQNHAVLHIQGTSQELLPAS